MRHVTEMTNERTSCYTMGVATTTDTTDSVRTSFETLKNLYRMSVQVDGTTKKRKSV